MKKNCLIQTALLRDDFGIEAAVLHSGNRLQKTNTLVAFATETTHARPTFSAQFPDIRELHQSHSRNK